TDEVSRRRRRDRLFFEDRIAAVFDLPFLHKRVFIEGTGGRPHLDALIAVQKSMRSLERAHGNQMDLDAFPVARFCEFLYRPLEPALFLGSVSNTQLHRSAAAREGIQHAGGRARRFAPSARTAVAEEVVRAGNAQEDEQENEYLAEGGQLRAVRHTLCYPPSGAAPSFR